MDWKQILSVSTDELTDLKRDEIYEHLVALRRETLDKKHFKKLIDLMQHILKYKGDMVNSLLTELEGISTKDLQHINTEAVLTENEHLKDLIAKLDADKAKLKARLAELTAENAFLQRRSTDAGTPGGLGAAPAGSDREDSPDVLSELDRHEELLATISQKNKHIKRLLRDIDTLEAQSGTQRSHCDELRDRLHDATGNIHRLDAQLGDHRSRLAEQATVIDGLQLNVRNLQDQLSVMEHERAQREAEIAEFGCRLEERAVRWRSMLQEKDDRLDSMRTKYEHVLEQNPAGSDTIETAERAEMQRMAGAIDERDALIAELEQKVQELGREMIDTTDVLNRLAKEREGVDSARLSKCPSCCEMRGRLEMTAGRCAELQELMVAAEEDSARKAQQAMDAISALNAFKSGADGLVQVLQRNTDLLAKVQCRDAQIRTLITEANGLQQLAAENLVLRKRLGMADDELVVTSSLAARQRKYEKHSERLALKLRASEEMRLQLKLDRNDLKRQLAQVHDGQIPAADANASRVCEQCTKRYSTADVRCASCANRQDVNWCPQCSGKLKDESVPQAANGDADNQLTHELSERYAIVVEENENLRIGMHEILQQLRNYDAESDHIVIDTPTLERLLHALDARSVSGWYHPAMRMQNELIAVRERELQLKERVRLNEQQPKESVPVADSKPITTAKYSELQSEKVSTEQMVPITFDSLVQRLLEQDHELTACQAAHQAALQRQREVELDNERLKSVEQQFHDLTEMLANAEDTQVAALSRQAEELLELRSQLSSAERKRAYAEEDFQLWQTQHRDKFDRQSAVLYEVRKQLAVQTSQQVQHTDPDIPIHINVGDPEELQRELTHLKLKLSKFSATALQEFAKLDADQQLPIDLDKITRLGMIQNGCAVHFITRSEVDTLRNEAKWLTDRNAQLEQTNRHLEDLLQLSQDQLRSQQTLLNERSEDEIALRHLIVDLQSDSQEKYIIAKMSRELKQAHGAEEDLKVENQRLVVEAGRLQQRLDEQIERVRKVEEKKQAKQTNCELKLKFLSKSHLDMRENFHQFTPLYPLVEFIQHYAMVLDAKRDLDKSSTEKTTSANDETVQQMCDAVRQSIDKGGNSMEDKIDIIKLQTQNTYLKQQLDLANDQIDELHTELKTIKLRSADWSQQWDTIRLLFGHSDASPKTEPPTTGSEKPVNVMHKETQSMVQTNEQSVNTEPLECVPAAGIIDVADNDFSDSSSSDHATFIMEPVPTQSATAPPMPAPRQKTPVIPVAAAAPAPAQLPAVALNTADISLASQLKQAMALASARSALLLDVDHQLSTAQTRIKALERSLLERDNALRDLRDEAAKASSPRREDNILSVTIASLQGLLLEKDTTLARYQELLRGERDNRSAAYEEHRKEVREVQQHIDELTAQLRTKDRELADLKSQKTAGNSARKESVKQPASAGLQRHVSFDTTGHMGQMSDDVIEDLFLIDDYRVDAEADAVDSDRLLHRIRELEEDALQLQAKLREVSKRESGWERTLCEKDKQIAALNNRIGQDQLNIEEISSSIAARRDLDQLREMLDEKDRHIGDLTETLTHFHDDQQKFMNDTSIHSAEQVSQLSADLSRAEATNRILTTQLEAVKRQLTAIAQRESQAREVIKTLKTQLIRRPVISVKTAAADRLGSSSREEQLQKRVHQLDQDLLQTREELRTQTAAAQCRRNKDAAELALWNKHKRSQQLADQLRQRLAEREQELDKVRGHLASAKTAVSRLEREKHILETRSSRGGAAGSAAPKYCQSPSCPNIHVSTASKYTPAESPDSYGAMLEYAQQQPPLSAESQPGSSRSRQTGVHLDISDGNQEVIEALRARIAQQQRRIVAMELEGRGGTALAGELERQQEKVSNADALNIRLEARNLNLQLENDMLRQGDQGEKTRRQIKHLEDYILALKSELTQTQINAADAQKSQSPASAGSSLSQQQHMEQSILTMRRIIERLKIENKQLKEGKSFAASAAASTGGGKAQTATIAKEMYEKMRLDLERVQQSYSEALDKISAQQIELDIQRSGASGDGEASQTSGGSANLDDVQALKEKLIKKTQLLEKAKILLGRAVAKEKQFREQVVFWKRRCAELQNVPVIDETSE